MSPLHDELRRALAHHADEVRPPADHLDRVRSRARTLRRRRRFEITGAAAVVVLAVGLGVPAGLHAARDSGTARLHPAGTPTSTSAPVPAAEPIDWQPRGTVIEQATSTAPCTGPDCAQVAQQKAKAEAQLAYAESTIRVTWAAEHHLSADDVAVSALWADHLPTGDLLYCGQVWNTHDAATASVAFFQIPYAGKGFPLQTIPVRQLVKEQGAANPSGIAEVSTVAAGKDYPWVLIVGRPGTTTMAYDNGRDGFRTEPTPDGIGIFQRDLGPGDTDRIRTLVGSTVTFTGPIDTGPSSPDV